MNKIKYLIITGFTLLFIRIPSVSAQLSDTEVELTKPVGGDILPGGQIVEGDIKASIIFSKIIPFVIKWTIGLAIVLSVIALIIGGYQYLTAYGDTEKHKNAQKTITYATIGLILAITAFGIVQIITSIRLS